MTAEAAEHVPAVSVVIPTLDRLSFLRRAVDCVLSQTVRDLELVVVLDGGTEEIADFVAGYPDPRVRLVRHERSRGVAAARNTGIAAARGSTVAFLDDDDIWLPEKLERQLAAVDRGADVVHTLVYVASGDGTVFPRPSEDGFRLFREVAAAGYPYHWLIRRSSYFINTFLVRRRCLDVVGGFDEELPGVDDLDFVHRLWRSFDLTLVDEPLAKYCFHGANQVNTKDPEVSIRLARKELRWLAANPQPREREIRAYFFREIAQAAWIAGSYRRVVLPALRARRLDPGAMPLRTLVKYVAAAGLPRRLVDRARTRTRHLRVPAEPYPWIDLY